MADEPKADAASAPHIRTYASDAAALGGTVDVRPTPAPPPPPKPEPKPEPAPAAPPPPPPPPPRAPDLPPAKIIPHAPTTAESREEVLARLKATASGTEEVYRPAPKAPDANESREAVLKRLQKNAPVAEGPARIHTYKTDFADKTRRAGATPISVLAAQQDAGNAPAPAVLKTRTNFLPFIGGALLIIGSIAGMYFAYQFVVNRNAVPFIAGVPSLIFADERAEITGEGIALQQELAALGERSLGEGDVLVAYVTYATTTKKGDVVREPAAGGTLIAAMALPAPEIVLRNVEPSSTVGIVRAEDQQYPFFILRVSSFDRTFAGMLSWENSLSDDLSTFYPAYPYDAIGAAEALSTSTPSYVPRFTDLVVANRNVRAFKDEAGRTVLLYGYQDKNTLVIARNEAAFKEIVARLSGAR